MKYLRTFLLVLLTVVLPLRGAVAAALLCQGGQASGSSVVAAAHGHHDMQADQAMHAHHAIQDHAPNDSADEVASSATTKACQVCTSGCCVTPLTFALPAVAGPMPSGSVAFWYDATPVPACHSGGLDRPPRTI